MGNKDIKQKTDRELLEELVKNKRKEDRRKAIEAACRVLLICLFLALCLKNLPKMIKTFYSKKKDAETLAKILGAMNRV